MTENYYAKKLNASKLYRVYDTKIARVRQYLDAEIGFVRNALQGHEDVLELGAGYGRIMKTLAPFAHSFMGIDISAESVVFGNEYLKCTTNCLLQEMDAYALSFDATFDVVLCLQNGLSALKGQDINLIAQAVHVLKDGGTAYFSTYSPRFWEHRLAWFHEQAGKGLLGEIDPEKTKNGVIVCKDGFTATTYTHDALEKLGERSGCDYHIEEVDDSSCFLILKKRGVLHEH